MGLCPKLGLNFNAPGRAYGLKHFLHIVPLNTEDIIYQEEGEDSKLSLLSVKGLNSAVDNYIHKALDVLNRLCFSRTSPWTLDSPALLSDFKII